MPRAIFLVVVAVCVLLIVPLASSQVLTGAITTTVNKDLMVGSIHMPVGQYKFSFDTATSRMFIHNQDTGETVSVFTRDIIDNSTPAGDKLVFRQDGDKRVLHHVWSEQAGHVHDVVHGTEVRELARK